METKETTDIIEFTEGDNALDFLEQHMQEIPYDPGFMKIQPNKGAKTFNVGALGTWDGPLRCIILSVSIARTLWSPDDTATSEQLAGVLQCLPKDIGKYNSSELKDWCNGRPLCLSKGDGTKGELTKIVDSDAPKIVPLMLQYPAQAAFNCAKCRWNKYETAFKGGRGKGCQEKHLLLLYFPSKDMAAFVAVPPTSLKAWRNYKISLPQQNFSKLFTAISTIPGGNDQYDFNVFDFEPVKEKSAIVMVEAKDVASLGTVVSYGGRDVIKLQALIAEFLNIEIEEEENGSEGSDTPEPSNNNSTPDNSSGGDDQPF